jgi:hypothetical protein
MERDAYNRETRISRAYREVIPHYSIERLKTGSGGGNLVSFQVKGKTRAKSSSDYTVTLSTDWSVDPACTCPDNRTKPGLGGYCKHVIATLLTEREHTCQLLELFLRGE